MRVARRMTFDPLDQDALVDAAGTIVAGLRDRLPQAPWSSDAGQQDAFRTTVRILTDGTSALDADEASKEAMVFWALTILYRDSMNFRLATASAKNWGALGTSRIATAFLAWVGSNSHPCRVVADTVELQLDLAARLREQILEKTLEIARVRAVPIEEASLHFETLFATLFEAFKHAGLSPADAERAALSEVLTVQVTPYSAGA